MTPEQMEIARLDIIARVRFNMLRYIAFVTTGDNEGDPQLGADQLKARAEQAERERDALREKLSTLRDGTVSNAVHDRHLAIEEGWRAEVERERDVAVDRAKQAEATARRLQAALEQVWDDITRPSNGEAVERIDLAVATVHAALATPPTADPSMTLAELTCPNCGRQYPERIAGLWLCQQCGHEWDTDWAKRRTPTADPEGTP